MALDSRWLSMAGENAILCQHSPRKIEPDHGSVRRHPPLKRALCRRSSYIPLLDASTKWWNGVEHRSNHLRLKALEDGEFSLSSIALLAATSSHAIDSSLGTHDGVVPLCKLWLEHVEPDCRVEILTLGTALQQLKQCSDRRSASSGTGKWETLSTTTRNSRPVNGSEIQLLLQQA